MKKRKRFSLTSSRIDEERRLANSLLRFISREVERQENALLLQLTVHSVLFSFFFSFVYSGGYWHVVLNMDLTVAVTQNFCSTTNFRMVWPRVIRSRPKMSKKFFERLKRRRPDLARIAEQIDPNSETGPQSDSSSSSSSSSSEDSSEDSPDESDTESISTQKKNERSFEQGDEQMVKKQRISMTK